MKRLPPRRPPVGRGLAIAVVLAAAMRAGMAAEDPSPAAATTPAPAPPAATAPAADAPAPAPAAAAPAGTAPAAATPPSDPSFIPLIELPTERLEQMRNLLDQLVQMTPEQRRALADEIREVERLKRDIRNTLENEFRRHLSPRDRDILRRYYATFRLEDATAWRARVRDTKEDERKKILHEMLTAAAARNITPNQELSEDTGAADPPRGRGPGFPSGGGPNGPGGDNGRGGGRGGRGRSSPAPPPTPAIPAPSSAAG